MDLSTKFIGDGKYVGDGGPVLEALWHLTRWRELRNCPGRYVSPDRVLRETTPRDLIQCHLPSYVKMPKRFNELENKDPVEITRFPGGGALITYCKEDGVYVHTLNTESGMIRKVEALGLPTSAISGESRSDYVEASLSTIIHILTFLDDSEKNSSAYSLVRKYRQRFAGQV